MIEKELIESIKSLDSSIEFDKEVQIFTIGNIDNWLYVARGLKEQYEFDYLMCITSLDFENNEKIKWGNFKLFSPFTKKKTNKPKKIKDKLSPSVHMADVL